jgi:DNA-binding NarL/FixJ family response regulator
MPELNGIDAARRIRTALPEMPIVLLTMHAEEIVILEALKAGINGYVFKTQTDQDLVHTLHMVADGSLFLGPNIPQGVIDALTHNSPQPSQTLTERERRILELIADGRTSREIAGILALSPKTIEAHRGRMMHKLKFSEAIQLVCYAVRAQMTKAVVTPLGTPD